MVSFSPAVVPDVSDLPSNQPTTSISTIAPEVVISDDDGIHPGVDNMIGDHVVLLAVDNDGIHPEDDDDRTLPEFFITNTDPKTTDNTNESTDFVINDREIVDNSNSKKHASARWTRRYRFQRALRRYRTQMGTTKIQD